jgi:lysozyme
MYSINALSIIKKYEGFRSKAYICPGGYKTIGYGHLLKKNEAYENISENDADELLIEDIKKIEKSMIRLINVSLTQNQIDALISFCFNVGVGSFQRSTMRQKINRLEHMLVPDEFKKWIFANGKKLKGLVLRRHEESNLYQM